LGRDLWYYADYPYVDRNSVSIMGTIGGGWTSQVYPVSRLGLSAWGQAVTAHASQLSTFWPDSGAMYEALYDYYQQEMGVRLWRRIGNIKNE
jgi:hypothetical protein